MAPLPLSAQQLNALRALRDGPKSAGEIRQLAGIDILPGALPTVLRALQARNLIAHVRVGNRGVNTCRGTWKLTAYGAELLRLHGEISPA